MLSGQDSVQSTVETVSACLLIEFSQPQPSHRKSKLVSGNSKWSTRSFSKLWLSMALDGDPKKSTAIGEDGIKGECSAAKMSAPTLTIRKELGGLNS